MIECASALPNNNDRIRNIYNENYAAQYEAMYLHQFSEKHETNRHYLDVLLPRERRRSMRWLDLCCGQAWHFSLYPEVLQRTGVDLSKAQLEIAQARNPGAEFICKDVLQAKFSPGCFDLITCFWGSYCYLDSFDGIGAFLSSAFDWTAPSGTVYIELLLPDVLASFNKCEFAERTGFRVEPRSADYVHWTHSDSGGWHLMTSPTLEWFADRFSQNFRNLWMDSDGGFVVHLVGMGRG